MVSTRRNPNAISERATMKADDDTSEDERSPSEENDESIDGNTSEHDDTLVPDKKRARSGRAPTKTDRKKYVRGKQGGLKGLMKMPVEIFTEIAYLLNPGDLISLARSNKLFRKMLLKHSAVQIWQRAESNVPGLPPCPAGVCEPQYAALVFSKYCTLCGASAPSKPDLDLRARLCTSCRDTEVKVISPKRDRPEVDLTLVHYSIRTRPKKNKSQPRTPMDAIFVMRNEVDEILEKQEEFDHVGDQQGLAQWEEERRAEVLARRMHARQVFNYIREAEASREEDLDSMKQQRRETIIDRLKALGWVDEDLDFEGPELKPWHALVDAPKPLTDRVWANILPKLTQMLEENRERHIASTKRKRQIERRACVDKFLLNMKYSEHPFEPIFKALGVPTPPPPDLDGCVGMLRLLAFSDARPETPNPFPKPQTALKWDCLRDLDEPEISIEEVEARLEQRKEQIEENVLEWRTLVEQQLVEKFESPADRANDVVLKVAGSIDSTIHLPRNTRLLLRADTLFLQEGSNTNSASFMSHGGSPPCYYPNFVSSFFDGLEESEDYTSPDSGQETDLDRYTRDIETERIVKSLLHELGMQDVSHIELGVFESRFTCGRCKSGKPKTWKDMVKHYVQELKFWTIQNDAHDNRVRYPVVVRNVHDTESINDPKPLIHLLTEEEAGQTAGSGSISPYPPVRNLPRCYLCEATGRPDFRMNRGDMLVHAQEVHDVAEPIVEGVHYGNTSNTEWYDAWNAFHDEREPTDLGSPSVGSCSAAHPFVDFRLLKPLLGVKSDINASAAMINESVAEMPEAKEGGIERGENLEPVVGDSFDQDDTSAPSKKRARSEHEPAKPPRRKYARGKQGGLGGLMNMPIEIFAEIAYLLNPGDLVALSRSSRFFRNVLLQRSAVQMWRQAESNMPGLPPCPPDMCEPQYAALIFSKYCTLCGASATAKPDPFLGVRLCQSCRDTKLQELNSKRDAVVKLVFHSNQIRPKRTESQPRLSRNSVFSLKYEVEEVYKKRVDFRSSGDEKGLAQWEESRRAEVLARDKHAPRVRLYLEKMVWAREGELVSIKEQRRETIVERLKALGWTEEDTSGRGIGGEEWRALVEAPKPLTDRIWKNLLPKLIRLMEKNREWKVECARQQRKNERRECIGKFLLGMRRTAHLFQCVIGALGVAPAPAPSLNGPKIPTLPKSNFELTSPFPKVFTALEWDCLNDLFEMEVTIEEVKAKLEERKAQVEAKVVEWRTAVEQRLVDKLGLEINAHDEATLVVKGNTELAAHLSRNARTLLRADTIFKRAELVPYDNFRWSYGPRYYPDLVSSSSNLGPETNLDEYERATGAEQIVKALLGELGMPDITLAELELGNHWFLCERCVDRMPKTWRGLVEHYVIQCWNDQKDSQGKYPVRHPIVYRNVHDPESTEISKPLVRLYKEEDIDQLLTRMTSAPKDGPASRPRCHLCKCTGKTGVRLGQVDMLVHLQDVHGVTEAVEGLHYGMQSYGSQGDKWYKEWDAYHDARESETTALAMVTHPA